MELNKVRLKSCLILREEFFSTKIFILKNKSTECKAYIEHTVITNFSHPVFNRNIIARKPQEALLFQFSTLENNVFYTLVYNMRTDKDGNIDPSRKE